MTSTENQSAPAAHFEVGTGPGVDADENDAAPPARSSEVGTGSGANAGENYAAPPARFSEVGTGSGANAGENDAAPPARFSEVGTGSGANAGENDAEGRTGPEADAGVNGNENQIVCDYTSFVRQLLSKDINETKLVIGEPGVEVEIDESRFAKRKYGGSHRWVVGAVDKSEDN